MWFSPVSLFVCFPRTLLLSKNVNILVDKKTRFMKAKSQFIELLEGISAKKMA